MKKVKKEKGWGKCYRVEFDIVLLFGLTELKAQVAWKEGVSGIPVFREKKKKEKVLMKLIFGYTEHRKKASINFVIRDVVLSF